MIQLARILIILMITIVAHAQEESNVVEVRILGIANEKGQMIIGLYENEASWLKKPVKGAFGEIIDGKSEARFINVPDGTYAISVFHDKDDDGKLDTMLGIPREDVGSSNDAPAKFGPPKWEDAKFVVKGGITVQTINL